MDKQIAYRNDKRVASVPRTALNPGLNDNEVSNEKQSTRTSELNRAAVPP